MTTMNPVREVASRKQSRGEGQTPVAMSQTPDTQNTRVNRSQGNTGREKKMLMENGKKILHAQRTKTQDTSEKEATTSGKLVTAGCEPAMRERGRTWRVGSGLALVPGHATASH